MKKFYLFLAFLPLVTGGFSQTLTSTDIRPQWGESFLQHRLLITDSVDPGGAGTAQVWDWSHATFLVAQDTRLVALSVSETPYPLSSGTFAIESYLVSDSAATAGFAYFQDTVNGFYPVEEYVGPLYVNYSDPEFLFRMPLSYADSTMDTICYSSTGFSITYDYCGTGKLKYDGTGTLLLPSGSYSGASRFRRESVLIRESFNDTSFTVDYLWFLPGVHWPVARFISRLDPNGQTYVNGRFLDLTTLGTGQLPAEISLQIYPNPADAFCRLESEKPLLSLSIQDISGRQMASYAGGGESTMVLPLSDLPGGIYLIYAEDVAGHTTVKRLVVTH